MSTSTTSTERKALGLRLAPWLGCLAMIGLLILATTQWNEWTSSRRIQSTQNAYVKSDFAVLSAKVSGYVKALPLGDYEQVKAGDLIAQIDPADYELAVAAARAEQSKAQAHLDNLDGEIAQQQARIKEAQAKLRSVQVRVRQYRNNPSRQARLVKEGALSRQGYENAQADLDEAISQGEAATAQVELAKNSLKVLQGQRAIRTADLKSAEAALESARRNLGYTRIVAPFDGVLNKRHVQVGSLLNQGTQIVSIVPLEQAYVIANYKETQLAHVQPGQPVELTVDGLPGGSWRGRVVEIAPMSGAESSLLPADNASGNFTKVVQRIPVRIELEPGQAQLERLRPGMSAQARIDTAGSHVAAYDTPGLKQTRQLAVVRAQEG
ncbi:HlyD family secretion protein [Alcaligenes nematophilus]|uniref:HlyD family secretion protein n=1 Tax=Alcaligenes nematophilus TaxID=2994643 RepID=A0ABU3MXU0_9BURK|nr:HlyD family secretion protein [Alcaligenes nematophilus]MDT8466352.1 HlyD family secretion protein [Alcaligenes nematophilus]MDT8470309.1 HlyD family secretion protein [Alcaligenes nematophilus]MDT8505460.1 HlyD family secretion protein [Alcaligenes nematophilus]MDT8526083.1 HlyD family secretion protein [Alcaligenes nematophilus]